MFSFTARGHNQCAAKKNHIFKLLKGNRAITHLLPCWAESFVQLGSIRQIKLQMGNPRWPIFLGVGSGCLQMFPHYSYGISKQLFPTGHESILNPASCAYYVSVIGSRAELSSTQDVRKCSRPGKKFLADTSTC